jgi:predicted ATPase/class 3 adenylate cyclase
MQLSAAHPGRAGLAETLVPFVPRMALDWLRDSPEAVHRRLGGTLLFVDVSGFTALTERLAARGKAGAEEITDVIGTVFGQLLGIATSYGADLLKWGGDAVLLFFPEPASAPRACRAAALMSRAMARTGNFRTSAGRVTLGVSIGGHSGEFDFYLLGDRHRELVVTGPAASITARMEQVAESGEVVVSRDTARRLEPGVLGAAKLEGVLLSDVPDGEALPPSPPPPEAAALDVASLLPADTQAHLLGGGEEAEHRQASVAFLEFSGTDALSLSAGPEVVAAWLGPLVSAVEEAAARYEVNFHETDIGRDGGKIVLLGGVPSLRGNDAERLLRAAHNVVEAHPPSSPIGLRVGVNAGRVFVFSHDFGHAHRRIFAVTGDAVNLAARVMGHAEPRQLLATQTVLVRARNPFETEALAPFKVKGKSQAIVAFAVGAPRQLVPEEAGGLAFVGREPELEALLGRAREASEGSGGVVEVIGAPGIGKSRLVSEAIDRWSLTALRVACEDYGSATPYLPFRRVYRRLLGLVDNTPNDVAASELRRVVNDLMPELEPFLPLLADVVDVHVPSTRAVDELEPRFRRTRLEDCAVGLLRAFVTGPSALVFEDAHAMDEASASLLGKIALESAELPLLVVLTRRPESRTSLPERADRVLVIDLKPLTGEAAARLAGGGAGPALTPAQVAAIVDRANGNPLFLRELLRASGEAGGIEALPESIEPLLAAEIDLLSPADRKVLRAAAVLGAQFDPAILHELLEEGATIDDPVWSRLVAFIVPTATGRRFAHGLMRDAAYEGLSFRRRKELHGRAARAIEARTERPEEAAELLSLHWLHAECYEPAWRYSRLSGDRARALWANADAATFYARALEAARRLGSLSPREVLAVAEALGDACELTASYDRSRDAYARARRLAEEPLDRARLLRKTGVLYERQGRYREALACYSRGRRHLETGHLETGHLETGHLETGHLESESDAAGTERSELDLASAGVRSRQGRHHDCIRFAAEAAQEAARVSHSSGYAHALYLQHATSVYLNQPNDDLALAALSVFEKLGDLVGQGNVLNNLGMSAFYQGNWDASVNYNTRSRQARVRSGDVVGEATEAYNLAEILSDQGELETARSLLGSARATWRAAGYRVGAALATSDLGRLEARAGDVDAGRRLLDEALAALLGIRSPVFAAETRARLLECYVLEGDFTAAIALSTELLSDTQGKPGYEHIELTILRVLGTATALAELTRGPAGGQGAQSRPLDHCRPLEHAIERATAMRAPYELALCLATRALLNLATERGGPCGDGHAQEGPAHNGAPRDHDRAEELFDRLGVKQAVITWSKKVTGEPIFARRVAPAVVLGGTSHSY